MSWTIAPPSVARDLEGFLEDANGADVTGEEKLALVHIVRTHSPIESACHPTSCSPLLVILDLQVALISHQLSDHAVNRQAQ